MTSPLPRECSTTELRWRHDRRRPRLTEPNATDALNPGCAGMKGGMIARGKPTRRLPSSSYAPIKIQISSFRRIAPHLATLKPISSVSTWPSELSFPPFLPSRWRLLRPSGWPVRAPSYMMTPSPAARSLNPARAAKGPSAPAPAKHRSVPPKPQSLPAPLRTCASISRPFRFDPSC